MNHPFWGPGYTHLWETLCIFWLVIWSPVPQGWMFTPLRWFQGPKGHAEVMISWGTCPMWCRVLLIPGCHGRKMLRSIRRNQDFLGSIWSLKIGIFHFWIWQQNPFLLPMAPWWSGGFKDVLFFTQKGQKHQAVIPSGSENGGQFRGKETMSLDFYGRISPIYRKKQYGNIFPIKSKGFL